MARGETPNLRRNALWDAPDAGYTNQGRGRGESTWATSLSLESPVKRPYCPTRRSGLSPGRCLALAVCGFQPKYAALLIERCLQVQTAYLGIGRVVTSHEWTKGFIDHYFVTRSRESLWTAKSVDHSILHRLELPCKWKDWPTIPSRPFPNPRA